MFKNASITRFQFHPQISYIVEHELYCSLSVWGRINLLSFSNPICQNSNFQFQCSCCWINQQVESWSVVGGGSWCWCWCYSNSISSKLCRRLCGGEEKPTTSFIALPPTASLSIYKMQILQFSSSSNHIYMIAYFHIFSSFSDATFRMRS